MREFLCLTGCCLLGVCWAVDYDWTPPEETVEIPKRRYLEFLIEYYKVKLLVNRKKEQKILQVERLAGRCPLGNLCPSV